MSEKAIMGLLALLAFFAGVGVTRLLIDGLILLMVCKYGSYALEIGPVLFCAALGGGSMVGVGALLARQVTPEEKEDGSDEEV